MTGPVPGRGPINEPEMAGTSTRTGPDPSPGPEPLSGSHSIKYNCLNTFYIFIMFFLLKT